MSHKEPSPLTVQQRAGHRPTLIVGSDNVANNLRATDRTPGLNPRASRHLVQAFDDAAAEALTTRNDGTLMSYWPRVPLGLM